MTKRKTISKASDATTIKALATAATKINRDLAKASKLDGQADDARLAAAIALAKAKQDCETVKQPFKPWCEKHIKQSWETVRKLVAIGESDNPAEALAAIRQRNAERNKAHREKRAHAGKGAAKGKSLAPPDPFGDAERAIAKLNDVGQISLIKEFARKHGLRVVEAKTLDALHNRIEYLEKHQVKHDTAVSRDTNPDDLTVPAFLKRDKPAKAKRARKTTAKAKRARKAA